MAAIGPEEHRRRWAELSPLARSYAAIWDVLRADAQIDLLELFEADPAVVTRAVEEFEEAFAEWFTGDEGDLPAHGAVIPVADPDALPIDLLPVDAEPGPRWQFADDPDARRVHGTEGDQ